ncbi:MAG: recombinase family protein [Bacteroidia bacterium]|nr:recombinase family protein [Bacteroidia bacterium]
MRQNTGKFVSYLRVSTTKQEVSGLGLEAQRKAVLDFLNGGNWELLAEYTETESGKKNDRPKLTKALEHCKLTGATLVIAKLDRLSRNAHFLLGLQEAGVKFLAADMPTANELTVGIMALVAQEERKAISTRTKAALAAAKERGVKLGCPNGASHLQGDRNGSKQGLEAIKMKAKERAMKLAEVVKEIQDNGAISLRQIAEELNRRSIATARGKRWHPSSVKNLLALHELMQ